MKNFTASLSTLVFSAVLASGCASINSVSLTPIPSQRNKIVRAEVSKTVILAFSFDNDFVDPLVADLKAQCPQGVVSGILTKDEIISYVFVYRHHIVATGFCNSSIASKATPKRKTATDGGADETDSSNKETLEN
jgi:hypothetical protein